MKMTLAKGFEERLKHDFEQSFPNGTIDRIYDVVSGNKGVSNVSDFIAYVYPYHFYLEAKTHKGASVPFSAISQYDKLLRKVGIHGVRAGVVVWLYEKDVVLYVPVSTITELKKSGEKSVGIRNLGEYNIKVLESKKLRRYMETDYSQLYNLLDGE